MTAEELSGRLRLGDDLGDDPLIVVDCTHTGAIDGPRFERQLSGVPSIFVALGTDRAQVADVFDLVAANDRDIDEIADVVSEHREAAISLAMLLRGAAHRSVTEGLLAESTTYSMLQAGRDHRRWLDARVDTPPTPDIDDVVRLEREGRRLHITLDRPYVHNAFNAAMRDALLDAFALVKADRSLDATLDANGRSFCSGGDLTEFGTTDDPAAAHVLRVRRSVGRAIDEVADRVTVHVKGHCIGAGVELPAFAGRIIADPGATFALPELLMGLIPGAGGTVSIPRRIGRQRTLMMALSGEPVDATVAAEWGLVDDVAPVPTT
jgi:hypothetical protein